VRFQVGDRGQGAQQGQADRRRSTFHALTAVADYYAPVRAGSDIAFLAGVINYLLTHDKIQHEYVKTYTDVSFIVRADYSFENGLFSGYNAEKTQLRQNHLDVRTGGGRLRQNRPDAHAPALRVHPHEAALRALHAEVVSNITGTPKEQFLKICEMIAETSVPNRTMTIMYALGWTQHSVGSQMIRTAAMVQLLLVMKLGVVLVTVFFCFRDGKEIIKQLQQGLVRFLGKYQHVYLQARRQHCPCRSLWPGACALDRVCWQDLVTLLPASRHHCYWEQLPHCWPGSHGSNTGMVSHWHLLILTDQLWPGIGLLLWGFLVVSTVDNVIRPLVISGASRVPFLVVLFGVLGGLTAFGAVGLF